MEKNELEKNEELEPKEAAETKEEPTQEEASVTDAPAAEEAVETTEEPVTAEASAKETAEELEIEETEELKQEEPPAEVPAAQKAEKGGVLGIVIGLIALIAIVAYAWMNPMGKAVDTGILYTKDDNLYYYDLKNELSGAGRTEQRRHLSLLLHCLGRKRDRGRQLSVFLR